MIPPELVQAIGRSQRVLCISHVKPDGDAVGSLLGISHLLWGLGKEATPALQDAPPEELLALPGAEAIVGAAGLGFGYDTVIAVDASSADRMGNVYRDVDRAAPLLVIDHHVTNTRFGLHNWVQPDAAATCQMLVELADILGAPTTPTVAQCLLTGIVTDTLCFRTSNTTPAVLATAMRLMQAGGVLTDITENLFDQRPFSVLRLWGIILDRACLEDGVIWASVARDDLNRAGSEADEDGSLSSMLIRTMGADVSASFLEKVDEQGQPAVECSFRARRGFDISQVAAQLGGGGHPQAGGCTVHGGLNAVIERVVPMLKSARHSQMPGALTSMNRQ